MKRMELEGKQLKDRGSTGLRSDMTVSSIVWLHFLTGCVDPAATQDS